MADSEEFRLKRLKHEERLSRVFDEVMGLGDFADSSRGSASSSRSGGQDEIKGADEASGQDEGKPVEEEDSNGSRQEEKMDEGMEESSFPRSSSPSSVQNSSFAMGTTERGGKGGAACDDALDGLPSFGPEQEEEEDWHYALPMGSGEGVHVGKTNRKTGPPGVGNKDGPVLPRPEEEEEEPEREGSTESANTSHSSKDHTPENSRDGGVLNQTEETEDSQEGEGERSEAAPLEDSNPPTMSAPINIKDEPIDEGYDNALLPQSSIRQIKEELENQEEELRISSVYSVGGGNAFASPPVPAAVAAPPTTAIFIPGRGALIQSMAPFPLRPPAPIPSSLPALVPAAPRPPPPAVPGSVRCSGCSKVLLKGQTAFQRKGSTQLFCSTVCLTGHLPVATKNRSCCQCNREILQPRDMITIPADDSSFFNFCGQFCLSVFRHKKKQTDKVPDKRLERKPEKPPEKPAERPPDKPVCSVCRVANRIEHEVTHQGRLHRLCSDACFVTWRKMRHLAMNCCEGCGLYCSSSSCQTLTIDRSQLNFCGPTCIGTYKQSCRKTVECACCHKMAIVSFTIMERDQRGKVQLYCSSACVEQSRPPRHMLSGAAFPCCLCKVSAVPQYHLAMVDGTIRNFCSYDCVSIYRKSGITSQPDLTNGTSVMRDPSLRDAPKAGPSAGASSVPPIPQDYSSPVPYPGHHPSHTSVPPLVPSYTAMSSPSVPGQAQARATAGQTLKPAEDGPNVPSKLTCHQCSKRFSVTPLLFSHQGRISMFCSKACCEQYKTQKNVLMLCEGCKQEKLLFDTISYNQQDLIFCSESCKLLLKRALTWRSCSYCSGFSQKMLHSHYGGRLEEFCRPHCMSQYTVLYYGMGRCDGCRKQGYMSEKLQCLGSVRNFCTLPCLLQYCYLHFEPSQHPGSNGAAPQTPYAPTQPHPSKMNPVIADVVSLANGSATQPSMSGDTPLTGALPTSSGDSKNLDHASTQHSSTQTDAMRAPASRRRQMKNKSVLCRPFTMDQESMCQLPTPFDELTALLDSPSHPDQSSDASTSSAPSPKPQGLTKPCTGVPARLTGRHFLAKRESAADCKVCSQHKRKREEEEEQQEEKKQKMEEGQRPEGKVEEDFGEAEGLELRDANNGERKEAEPSHRKQSSASARQTAYYCKTCSAEPSLCPVPCFELYHTRLIYKTAPELEAPALTPPPGCSSSGEEKVKLVMVPVPVPVFIPVPMNMYSQHTPVPMAVPVPVPVPMVVPPPQKKELKDAAVQSEPLPAEEEEPVSRADQGGSHNGDVESEVVAPVTRDDEEDTGKAADLPPTVGPEGSTESADPQPDTQPEAATATGDPPTTSADHQPPSSPMMDLETDIPSESLDQKPPAPKRGVKRSREGYTSRKRGRRRTVSLNRGAAAPPVVSKLNHLYGVKAWRSWVRQLKEEQGESDLVDIKEDVLQCDSAELSFALTRFIREVRRPTGDSYSPDSIFYLCLGIQQYLFMKGRIENIFTDALYSQFATKISGMLSLWRPRLLPAGGTVSSRVVESYLWECKQLGAYSPIVLLNTLLFFCTKTFGFTTLLQHQSLSFTNFTRHSKACSRAGKVHYLRYQRRSAATPHTDGTRRKQEEGDLEMLENVANPLHCPVRLYEFYLSRCPAAVKTRADVFFLQPEKKVHTHSPHWYTSQPLEGATLQSMLTRILAVREVQQHLGPEAVQQQSSADPDGLQ